MKLENISRLLNKRDTIDKNIRGLEDTLENGATDANGCFLITRLTLGNKMYGYGTYNFEALQCSGHEEMQLPVSRETVQSWLETMQKRREKVTSKIKAELQKSMEDL